MPRAPRGGDVFAWRYYLMGQRHFEAPVLYFEHQLHLLQHPERILELDVIDAGANDGDSALMFSRHFNGHIYAFEPVRDYHEALLHTIALNGCSRIVPVRQALGAKEGSAQIKVCGIASSLQSSHYLWSRADVPVELVSITTLDRFVEEHPQVRIGLIKVDIEGLEQDFLAGAEQTIRRFRPALLLSIYHNVDDFFDIKPLLESWDLGYRFTVSQPVFGHPYVDTMLICEQP